MSGKKVLSALFLLLLILPLVNALGQDSVNIALYHLTPKQELCRCEAFNYNLVVYNTGDFNETYSFGVSRYAPNFNISPSTVSLEPKQTANIGIGARLPCSVTQPSIDFIARTHKSRLKVKTTIQIGVNASCTATDINMSQVVKVFPEKARALSALFVFLLFLMIILALLLIYVKRPKKEYWWSSYFKARLERKIGLIEVITIIIVVILLLFIGFKGFQQIGKNETLITTYLGPENETLPTTNITTNITTQPAPEKGPGLVEKGVHALSRVKQFLWPYKVYILIGLIVLFLLILVIAMSVIIIRRRKARPKITRRKPRRKIKWRYVIIPLVVIFLLALIAVSAFLVYKYRYKIITLLSQIITKLNLTKAKDFLLPKLRTLLGFVKDGFDFISPYVLYIVIGVILLVVIILLLRRREKANARIVSVKEEAPKKARKKKKVKKRK